MLEEIEYFVFSQNYKIRISKALVSKIYPDFKFDFYSVWRCVEIERAFFHFSFHQRTKLALTPVLELVSSRNVAVNHQRWGPSPNSSYSQNRAADRVVEFSPQMLFLDVNIRQ